MTWCALVLSLECLHPRTSVFRFPTQDLWANQFLLWSILGGIVSVFPVIYIPVINTKVFLHKSITWEWGVAIGCTLLFLLGAELWKWGKRIISRTAKASNPEYELERNDPFQKYASFSKSNTMVVV